MSSLSLDWPNRFNGQGGDFRRSATGSLLTVSGTTLAVQKLIRWALSNPREVQDDGTVLPPDYIFVPNFGEGLQRRIGDSYGDAQVKDIKKTFLAACAAIDEIAKVPPPQVTVQPAVNGLRVTINYRDAQTNRPYAIGFTLPTS